GRRPLAELRRLAALANISHLYSILDLKNDGPFISAAPPRWALGAAFPPPGENASFPHHWPSAGPWQLRASVQASRARRRACRAGFASWPGTLGPPGEAP